MSSKEFGLMSVEDEERRTSRWLLWLTVGSLVASLTWAALFHLDEVTRGQGKVIPASREQVVQSLDAGVVTEILVREGAHVKRDDVLIRLDDGRSGPVFREAREKKKALQAMAARLRAEAYGRALEFDKDTPAAIAGRERQAYAARRQSMDEAVSSIKRSLEALNREIAMTEPMTRQGLMSEVELLRLRRQQSELMGQMDERKNRYATEAANAAMAFGFDELGLAEIVSFTAAINLRSQKVMQKTGMTWSGEVFQHPNVDAASPLRPHVLYRKARP